MPPEEGSTRLAIRATRGETFESEHAVSAVLCDPTGRVLERVGPALGPLTWRSAAKPFQLEASLGMLPEDLTGGLSERDLAIGAASHSAQPAHVAKIRSLMARLSVRPDQLRCGAHWPVHEESRRDLARARPVHNNCSGKHAFMIAACANLGEPEVDYRAPECAVQRGIRAVIDARTAGLTEGVVIDGCGVPCFVLPLAGMAAAWARLAQAMTVPTAPSALGRIGHAMSREPWWMSGDGRLDLAAVAGASRPIVSKVGAEGLVCLALPFAGVGVALKTHSGDGAARAVALQAVLERWFPGLLPKSAVERWAEVRNVVGDGVGTRRAEWR